MIAWSIDPKTRSDNKAPSQIRSYHGQEDKGARARPLHQRRRSQIESTFKGAYAAQENLEGTETHRGFIAPKGIDARYRIRPSTIGRQKRRPVGAFSLFLRCRYELPVVSSEGRIKPGDRRGRS